MTEKFYEQDKDYAHACANLLHDLHREGVLSVNDLQKFGNDQIEELVLRIHKNGFPARTSKMKLGNHDEKIQTIFASDIVPASETPDKKEITAFVSDFLQYIRSIGYDEVTGALVYGSLLDKRKKPRSTSDLDITLLVSSSSGAVHLENAWLRNPNSEVGSGDIPTESRYYDLTEDAYKFAKLKHPKFADREFSINNVLNKELFNYRMDPFDKKEAPWWLYSTGIFAVGGFPGVSEAALNNTLQKALKSKWLAELKQRTINDIKKDLDHNFGKMGK